MDENSIGKLLLEKDKKGETFLFNKNISGETLQAILTFTNEEILRKILITRNNENENFLVADWNLFKFIQILTFIKGSFPDDLQLFRSLFNDTNNEGVQLLEKIKLACEAKDKNVLLKWFHANFTEDELREIFGDDFKMKLENFQYLRFIKPKHI
jgi:hypothetical protein